MVSVESDGWHMPLRWASVRSVKDTGSQQLPSLLSRLPFPRAPPTGQWPRPLPTHLHKGQRLRVAHNKFRKAPPIGQWETLGLYPRISTRLRG
jgi:hypothetical protein